MGNTYMPNQPELQVNIFSKGQNIAFPSSDVSPNSRLMRENLFCRSLKSYLTEYEVGGFEGNVTDFVPQKSCVNLNTFHFVSGEREPWSPSFPQTPSLAE